MGKQLIPLSAEALAALNKVWLTDNMEDGLVFWLEVINEASGWMTIISEHVKLPLQPWRTALVFVFEMKNKFEDLPLDEGDFL